MAETETFQHYEVLKNPDGSFCELGRGAMGVTYKAFDTSLRTLVALKVINAAYLESDIARQRFQREARAAAGLRHPNVAGVFHLGEEGGNFFYAMEFIDGETLEAFVRRRGPLPAPLALNLTLQVVRALRAAAKVGLVHRDIKPANLMLSREDEADTDEEIHVKVIDFGLAKLSRVDGAEASASITGSAIVGTPHYISPEQLEEKGLDTRSDIYSLGVTLWFMLTGKPPYSGSLMQVMSKHLTEPPPFTQLDRQPPQVCELLRHMLEKDPAHRPQTAAELRREIEQVLRDIGARPASVASAASDGLTSDTVRLAADETGESEMVGTPAPVKLSGVLVEPPKRVPPPAPAATDAPVHLVTHELPRRDPRAASAVPLAPSPTGGSVKVLLLVGGVLLILAVAGFGTWRWMSAPKAIAPLAGRTPTPEPPRPTLTPPAVATTPSAVVQGTSAPATTAPDPGGSPLDQALAAARHIADTSAPDEAVLAYTHVLDDFPDSKVAQRGVYASIRMLHVMQDLPPEIGQPMSAEEQARFTKVRAAVERAADAGFDPALLYLGDHLVQTEPLAAADWFRKAAAHGEPEAMHQLGNMYRRGSATGVEDPNYAHWFQEASDRKFPRAKVWLAECYSQGKGGVKQDDAKAFQLLTEAYEAEPNNAAMLEKLGFAYWKGRGTAVDLNKAFVLVRQAVDLGRLVACSTLGTFYMNGLGTEKDPTKAAATYLRGTEVNDAPCEFLYALCLEHGLGVTKDEPGAVAMMQRAVDGGFADAPGYLGTYYLHGFGMPAPVPEKAIELYRKGLADRNPLCQFRYAQCLENGRGLPADPAQAEKFYRLSAESGYQPAQEWVAQHKADKRRK